MNASNNSKGLPSPSTKTTSSLFNTSSKKNNNLFPPSSFTKVNQPAAVSSNQPLSALFSPVKDSVSDAMENTNSMMTVPVMLGLGFLTILLIIITIFRDQVAYLFQEMWNKIKSAFSPSDQPSAVPDNNQQPIDNAAVQNMIPSINVGAKEVFNIAEDKYKYSDAEPLCKAYGAELATYDQVKDAWNKGADWCNYGWVKGQAAVYPTQESTYNKLQAGPEDQKGACGITGVNGGYFDNPDLRFGVNCYGTKPGKSDADERAQQKPRNMTPDALEYDRKVQQYKTDIHEIPISPFNTTQWS